MNRIQGLAAALPLASLCLLIALAPSASAQVLQGTIDGNVTDTSGAAIPGATVTATNDQTGVVRSVETNAIGAYSLPTLPPGVYTLEVTFEGFQTARQTGVEVNPNAVARVNVAMEVGAVTETVEVAATAATLQTDRAEVRQEVTETQLKNVPIPLGRNYQMLFVTLPGFSPPQEAHSIPSNPSRSVQFSVNGTSRSNNNTRIDGVSATNIWLPHMTGYLPALESIETVNATTSSMDAEQGLAGGASISVNIKSGTNDVHGSAFEYHTNQHIKAYPWDNPRTDRKGKFIDNQFGGTIGGPIKKNKLFYFVSYEGRRESEFRFRQGDVATAAMRAGDFSNQMINARDAGAAIFDPATGDINGFNRTPFPNNQIPMNRFDVGIVNIFNTGDYPLPNQAGTGAFGTDNNYGASASTTFWRDTVDAKVNWNATDKFSSFIRFSMLDYSTTNPQFFGPLGGERFHRTNSNPGDGFGNTYSGTWSATYVVNPNFVLDGHFGYTLVDTNVEQQRLDENLGFTLMEIPGLQSDRRIDGGWPRIRIDGYDGMGITNAFMPYFRSDPQWQYVANANWTKGSHNIRFGTDYYVQHLDHNQPENPGAEGGSSGGFRFQTGSTLLNGGPRGENPNAFASFLLGLPGRSGKIWQFPDDGYHTRTKFLSFYLRDRWQVNSKLTMSLGLRYEIFPFPTRDTRGVEQFDFNTGKMLACGVGVNATDCGVTAGKYVMPKPRIGLAYRLDDNTVVRAGYGITNDPFNWARPLRTNYPILFTQVLNRPNSLGHAPSLRDGIPVIPEPDLGDGVLDLDPTAVATSVDNENAVRGYIQSWNLTLERRFGSWIGSAGYVATRSVNQMVRFEQNWSPIDGGNAGRVLNQRLGRTVATYNHGSMGTAKYDSLQTKLERRFSNGVQVNLAYTWGHSRGYTSESSGAAPNRVGIPWMYDLNYGRTSQDIRHNFQANWVAELPFGAGKPYANSGIAKHILGGWQFNGLISRYSGRPFTVTDSGNTLNAPGSSQFGDCVSEPIRLGETGLTSHYYDISSFARVPSAERRFGTCGINNLSGPALFNMDAGIFRKFQLSERVDLQFRAEMFNVTNTPHFREPRNGVNASNFMRVDRILNTGREGIDERTFRFGLRLGW